MNKNILDAFKELSSKKIFKVKLIPKSSENKIVGFLDEDTIKIKLKAIPEKGKANEELIKFLSKTLKVNKEKITIVKGKKSQLKTIKIYE